MALVVVFIWVSPLPNNFLLSNTFFMDMLANTTQYQAVQPTFLYLQKQFKTTSEMEWPKLLQQLTPSIPHNKLQIVPLSAVHLSKAQYQRLIKGKIIGVYLFFGAPIQNNQMAYDAIAYQRIGNSNQVIAYEDSADQVTDYVAQQAWLLHFIQLAMAQNPQNPSQALRGFSQEYQIPLALLPLSSLSAPMQGYLQTHSAIKDMNTNFSILNTLYYRISPTQVLRIGPYPSSQYINYMNTWILLISLGTVSVVMLLILFLLNRDFKKLGKLAEAYGQGQFDYPVKINRISAMYPLYANLKRMGAKIQQLISSHKELSQAISHELKTPLSRLKFAHGLIAEAKNEEQRINALKEADSAGDALAHLVNELLLYTRFDREFFKANTAIIDVQQCLNFLVADPKYTKFGKAINWQMGANLHQAQVQISEPYFKLLLDNLISNACRYADSKVEVNAYVQDQQMIFEVADDGPGIPEAYREKIFEPFFSLDESRSKDLSGHGLGLAIVERIIKAHQAQIEVSQAPQLGGALFRVKFPLSTSKITTGVS